MQRILLTLATGLFACACSGSGDDGDGSVLEVADLLADPARIETATLELEERSFTDVVPPGGGTRHVTLELGPTGASWQRMDTQDAPPDTVFEARGTLDFDQGRELLVRSLRTLDEGGWFELDDGIPERAEHFFAARQHRVRVELAGPAGRIAHARSLPYGSEHDEQFQPPIASFDSLLATSFR